MILIYLLERSFFKTESKTVISSQETKSKNVSKFLRDGSLWLDKENSLTPTSQATVAGS